MGLVSTVLAIEDSAEATSTSVLVRVYYICFMIIIILLRIIEKLMWSFDYSFSLRYVDKLFFAIYLQIVLSHYLGDVGVLYFWAADYEKPQMNPVFAQQDLETPLVFLSRCVGEWYRYLKQFVEAAFDEVLAGVFLQFIAI